MWNDTDIPLAFLITFRSHGTWLHGDERGSVNRFRNQYKSPRLPAEKKWLETNTRRLRDEPVILGADQRGCVEAAVHETCKYRSGISTQSMYELIMLTWWFRPVTGNRNSL